MVVGTLCELIGEGNFFDAAGARETVEIFKLLGLKSTSIPSYVFYKRKIFTNSIRGKLAWCREAFLQKICEKRRKVLMHQTDGDSNYIVQYSRFVDDETYAFMEAHSDKDVLLRKQETFDWILQYPFVQISPLYNHTPFDNEFTSIVKEYLSVCCKVMKDGMLIGVVVLVDYGDGMSVKYLYYEQESAKTVFRAIVDHLLPLRIIGFETNDVKLAEYVMPLRIFTKNYISQKSFSYPRDFVFSSNYKFQAGEGDMFV